MKKHLIIFFFLLTYNAVSAQKNSCTATDLIERLEYTKAIELLSKCIDASSKNTAGMLQLANCYYYTSNTGEAEKYYKLSYEAIKDKAIHFNYIDCLRSNKKYEEANAEMKKFASKYSSDSRSTTFQKKDNYIEALLNQQKKYTVKKININSDRSDFGGFLTDSTFYFVSSRIEQNKKYGWNEEPYLDIFSSTRKNDTIFSQPVPVKELNSAFHEGPISITKNGKNIYFSSESFTVNQFEKIKNKKLKSGQVQLFTATNDNGIWKNAKPLPFNSKLYSVSNPSVNSINTIVYFSSNMPGGIGGNDIWKATINADGTYGKPENLGPKINTEGDESFPFIDENNLLYFASNGRLGLGGLDIYKIDLNNESEAENLGISVNSSKDDFAFSTFFNRKIGYLSSNREGNDNIYSCVPDCTNYYAAVLTDASTNQPLSNAKVIVTDSNENIITSLQTDKNGWIEFKIACEKTPYLKIFKDGFITKTVAIAPTVDPNLKITIPIDPIPEVVVTDTEIYFNPILFEFNKYVITKQSKTILDKLVYIMNQNASMKIFIRAHTDSKGTAKYNLNLSEKRVQSTVNYIVSKGISATRISGKGFGESEPKIDCRDKCTADEHLQNRRSEFLIVKD
jgi:outer membrane protein OmpA-like peptidoglycan-associated protein